MNIINVAEITDETYPSKHSHIPSDEQRPLLEHSETYSKVPTVSGVKWKRTTTPVLSDQVSSLSVVAMFEFSGSPLSPVQAKLASTSMMYVLTKVFALFGSVISTVVAGSEVESDPRGTV
jgi:hypothetical protein